MRQFKGKNATMVDAIRVGKGPKAIEDVAEMDAIISNGFIIC